MVYDSCFIVCLATVADGWRGVTDTRHDQQSPRRWLPGHKQWWNRAKEGEWMARIVSGQDVGSGFKGVVRGISENEEPKGDVFIRLEIK